MTQVSQVLICQLLTDSSCCRLSQALWRGWDSATSYRRRRNDVRRRMRGREKMGGGERRSVASDTISAAHLFPLLPRARCTSFRETRSVERNLLLASERCIGNAQRRAEPPTYTSVSAGTQTPPYRRDSGERNLQQNTPSMLPS